MTTVVRKDEVPAHENSCAVAPISVAYDPKGMTLFITEASTNSVFTVAI